MDVYLRRELLADGGGIVRGTSTQSSKCRRIPSVEGNELLYSRGVKRSKKHASKRLPNVGKKGVESSSGASFPPTKRSSLGRNGARSFERRLPPAVTGDDVSLLGKPRGGLSRVVDAKRLAMPRAVARQVLLY